ncbi:hypothetical protein KA005_21285, partial [bacterium]|nr:hypothetical protein [bacterium]
MDDANWKPYDGNRSNFGQILNQASKAVQALVEKPINSIDALLVKNCRLRNINPESKSAPQTMSEAVEKFYNVKNGNFEEVLERRRREIAESIQIIATGDKKRPNIPIYDDGEGQHPTDFETTFLSLKGENKIKIRFVQGKFNQGSTGVLPFCGKQKYQLILSRKHPELLDGKRDLYGFTLVRLHQVISTEVYKQAWYEYCVDNSGRIFEFTAEDLDIGLFNRRFKSGTFIKMFCYDLPRASEITFDLWRDLNRYLYAPALPVLLYEKRFGLEKKKGRTPTKIMLGNRVRIMLDERYSKEMTFPISINFKKIHIPGEVTVFKETTDKNEFVGGVPLIFTINGQVHDDRSNSFIKYKAGLPYLSGSLLVSFDCSDIPPDIKDNDLFMSSRDRRRVTSTSRKLLDNIAKELHDNEVLRRLNEKRRDEKIYRNPRDDDFMKRLMGRLLRKNKDLAKILGLKTGDLKHGLKTIFKGDNGNGNIEFEGKRFPSFVRFKKLSKGNVKMVPLDGECTLTLETDVENEYLIRSSEPGELKIKFLTTATRVGNKHIKDRGTSDEELFDVNIVGPNQGQIKLRLKPQQHLQVGTEVGLNIELSSPEGPFTASTQIKIGNPQQKKARRKVKTSDSLALPELNEVYREKKKGIPSKCWNDYDWTGFDICEVIPSG